ncbi:MAG: prolyl oligopeptidase family serine peptidase [Planctomycetota bacterium]
MIDGLLAAGIAVAGIDVGESYGSPEGIRGYEALHRHLTESRSFAARPVLLARSRGGLMLYAWATLHPGSVAGIAGVYPVCDLVSYPGIERAAPAYGMTPEALEASLAKHNPIARLEALASAQVPILHIHGDRDTVVPLEANSGALAEAYRALGGAASVVVQEGRGHDMWSGWFRTEALLAFMIERAREGARSER